jgi:hypothetical protein
VVSSPVCRRSVTSWDSFTSVEVDQARVEDGGGGSIRAEGDNGN